MSYDVYLFQVREGVSAEEINTYLQSEDYTEYCDSSAFEEEGVLPEKYVNRSLSEDVLRVIAGKAFLRVKVPERERTEALNRYLESGEETEAPEPWKDELDMMFEYSGEGGMLPVVTSMGGADEMMKVALRMLEILEPQRIALFDPQVEKVYMGRVNWDDWSESMGEAFADLRSMLEDYLKENE